MSTDDSPDDEPLFDPRITSYPWPIGIFTGVFAFLLGYLVMVAVVFPTAEFGGNTTLVAKGRTVAFIFYNAHFVPLSFDPAPVLGIPQNYITGGSPSLPRPVYYLVPIVSIAVLAAGLARSTLSDAEIGEYVMPGLAVTIGYLVLGVVGSVAVEDSVAVQSGGTATWGPDVQLAAINFLLIPLVVGIAAGLAVGVYRNGDEVRRTFDR